MLIKDITSRLDNGEHFVGSKYSKRLLIVMGLLLLCVIVVCAETVDYPDDIDISRWKEEYLPLANDAEYFKKYGFVDSLYLWPVLQSRYPRVKADINDYVVFDISRVKSFPVTKTKPSIKENFVIYPCYEPWYHIRIIRNDKSRGGWAKLDIHPIEGIYLYTTDVYYPLREGPSEQSRIVFSPETAVPLINYEEYATLNPDSLYRVNGVYKNWCSLENRGWIPKNTENVRLYHESFKWRPKVGDIGPTLTFLLPLSEQFSDVFIELCRYLSADCEIVDAPDFRINTKGGSVEGTFSDIIFERGHESIHIMYKVLLSETVKREDIISFEYSAGPAETTYPRYINTGERYSISVKAEDIWGDIGE